MKNELDLNEIKTAFNKDFPDMETLHRIQESLLKTDDQLLALKEELNANWDALQFMLKLAYKKSLLEN